MPKSVKLNEIGLPPIGKEVLVQCEGFRGLAYRNDAGRWISVFGEMNLPKYVEIIQLDYKG
jgi:hypothetical protein